MWKYDLGLEGLYLKSLINQAKTVENIVSIYKQLIKCLLILKKKINIGSNKDFMIEVDNMADDLKVAYPDLNDDLDYYDEEETLNFYLREFYDLCDSERVWVSL